MKTYRNFIWITLFTFTAVFTSRLLIQNNSSSASPEANQPAPDIQKKSDSISSPTLPTPEPHTKTPPNIGELVTTEKTLSPPEDDPEKIAILISSLSETDVCNWLGSLTNQNLTDNTGRLLIRRWVELNPIAAANWVSQLEDTSARQTLVDAAAVAWSEKDLPSALAWVESMPENETKHQALADLGYEIARTDPVNAMQVATQLPASDYANGLLLHSLAQYTLVDPGQSQQLALSLPIGPLRDQALTTVATAQARQDGNGAAQFAVDNISPGHTLDNAVIGIVQLWGQNDFASAAGWVQSFPESPLRYQAVQSLGVIGAP